MVWRQRWSRQYALLVLPAGNHMHAELKLQNSAIQIHHMYILNCETSFVPKGILLVCPEAYLEAICFLLQALDRWRAVASASMMTITVQFFRNRFTHYVI